MNNRVELENLGRVELTEEVAYEFEVYALKRPGLYLVDGDLGRKLPEVSVRTAVRLEGDFRLIKSIDESGRLRLRVCTGRSPAKISVHVFPAFPADAGDPVLAEVWGRTELRNGIYREAARILEDRYSSLMFSAKALTPLLDCSFVPGDAGLEAWSHAVEGNFTGATGDTAYRHRDLLGEKPSRLQLRVHMPFLDRKETKRRSPALAGAWVESEHEQITVRRPNDEPLEHHLTAAALLARRDPGKHAFTIWMGAPGPKSILYRPAYHAVSLAAQRMLRLHVPQVWAQSAARTFRHLEADSLAVYRDSLPWRGLTRTDFSYDFLCQDSMERFFRSARTASPAKMVDAVQARPRFLNSILAAERQVIDSLINLGIICSEISYLHSTDPAEAARQISKFAASWAKSFRSTLKGVLPGLDCSCLARIILEEATCALTSALTPPDYLSAIFPAA